MSTQGTTASIPLRLRPDEIEIIPESRFENDRLGRQDFVKAMTELVGAIREPFVIALNAPWGSGKTTTLRLLEPDLATAGIPSVTFNAWEIDDATDPLVPLVASLHDQLMTLKGYASSANHAKIERLKSLGSAIAKHGAIAAVKLATAGLLDVGAAAEGIAKAAGDAADKAAEGMTGDLIDAFKRDREAAKQFRSLLEDLIALRTAVDDPPPLVLMIDELDRCRPTFAVAMLERIKHFFNVPGLVFILALDLEQLKASTRKVYGMELDATEYLRRFVDVELRLPRADVGDMVNSMLSNCGADAFFAARSGYPAVREDRGWIVNTLKTLAHHFELSPRQVQRMISRLMLVVRQTPVDHYLDPILVVFMIFLRLRHERLLRQLVAGRMEAGELMQELGNVSAGGRAFHDSHIGKLIEAHLLFAHGSRRDYVQKFVQTAQELGTESEDAESLRKKEVADMYRRVSQVYFQRSGLDLAAIERRLNLVSADLQVDDR